MENEIKEEWKDVVGYEGLYQVSNLGRVKKINTTQNNIIEMYEKEEQIRAQYLIHCGYKIVSLSKCGKSRNWLVSRLVAIAFIPNPLNLPCVNHKDEDKANNYVDNLEWCTYKYNRNYGTGIQRNAEAISKPVIQKSLDGEFIKAYKSRAQAGKESGVWSTSISQCIKGKRKSAGGYLWENN